ncbi:protein C19orf12 homolog [Daphnia pulicaria]|uniref:protein C19orf12 homolog n=1 Tax=Daphnia pulicaria TaxID=35523 RepID=UPI001EEA4208|nr:protein C19orf12 homolog [Daphnia pulicaria]
MDNVAKEIFESIIPLIGKLLEALCETEKIKVCIDGVKIDTGIAVAGTLLGTAVGGPVGGVVGSAVGTTILATKYKLGNDKYKPLMTVLREDLTEKERNSLYEKLWKKLNEFIIGSLGKVVSSNVNELKIIVLENPKLMEIFKNVLKENLSKKNMSLA